MSENSPRPHTRLQDQALPKGLQNLVSDSPVGSLSPYRIAKLRAQRLKFEEEFKSPLTLETEKPRSNLADALASGTLDHHQFTAKDIPVLLQLLAEKQKTIDSMRADLEESEQQATRLRTLRRGVNSPIGTPESTKKDRKRKMKDRLNEAGENARTPLAEMAVDSPVVATPTSYINELVVQTKKMQLENVELKNIELNRQKQLEESLEEARLEFKSLKEKCEATTKENIQLKEDVSQLNTALSSRSTDSEKITKELEMRVEELHAALAASAAKENEEQRREEGVLESLRSANAEMNDRLAQLQYAVKASELQATLVEREWLERMRKVTQENHDLQKKLVLADALADQVEKYRNENALLEDEKILIVVERDKFEKLYSEADVQLEECAAVCESLHGENDQLEATNAKLKTQIQQLKSRIRKMEAETTKVMSTAPPGAEVHSRAAVCSGQPLLWQQLRKLHEDVKLLSEENRSLRLEASAAWKTAEREKSQMVDRVSSAVLQTFTPLLTKYREEMALRKKLHNALVELKGNIRVLCRVRPVIKEDQSNGNKKLIVSCDQDDNSAVFVDYKDRKQKYDCDRVFDRHSTQQEVFDEVRPLVLSCIDGYNVCIFAYGQTGSGKTYTMEGTPADPGINQRALQELFSEIASRILDWKFTVSVSVLEIYNETLRDLLCDSSSKVEKLKVKMTADGDLEVPGLTWAEVESADDINNVSFIARQNRTTATTRMNERSSRSHALLCVNVEGLNRATGVKTIGKLNLVDLAGSERVYKSGAEGSRLKEAQSINRSLSSLADVIHALRTKQTHVPFRNSKLTYLLRNSLGGNSKTLMIVQVAPVEDHAGETMASLTFAQRIRSVEMGQATRKTTVERPK